MTRNFEGPFVSITGLGIDPIAARTERLLNDAADFIAATHKQPPDTRAWTQLLTYAPSDVLLERLIAKLNLDNIDPNSLTIGEIRRAIPLPNYPQVAMTQGTAQPLSPNSMVRMPEGSRGPEWGAQVHMTRWKQDTVEDCLDGGSCFLKSSKVPACIGSCAIWRARFSPNWARIQQSAAAGNRAAQTVIERGANTRRNRYGQDTGSVT